MIKNKAKRPKKYIILLLCISILLSWFFYEQNNRREVLHTVIKEEFSLDKNSYETSLSITQFGYLYTLVFEDEPQIEYEFFVKKNNQNQYVVTYYGHNADGTSPLKENKFTTLNDQK